MRGAAGGGTVLGASLAVGLAYWAGFGPRNQIWGSFPYRGHPDRQVPQHPAELHARADAGPGGGALLSTAPEKVVALSFDDGPNEPWTSRLLDVLAAKRVHATFFQV